MILLLTSGINLIILNRPPKKKTRNLTTRTYLKEQNAEALARVFLMALRRQSNQLNGREKFKVETFFPIIDMLSVHLRQRLSSYKNISKRFDFFFRLKTLNSEELRQSCKEFAEFYYQDVNEEELEMECLHLIEYLKIIHSENEGTDSILKIYQLLKENKIEDTFQM